MAVLFQLTLDDGNYLGVVKQHCQKLGLRGSYNVSTPETATEVVARAKSKGVTQVATTSNTLLRLLLLATGVNIGRRREFLNDYEGSIIEFSGIEFLILPPLHQHFTTTTGEFRIERYLRKFSHVRSWLAIPEFTWELFEPKLLEKWITLFQRASFVAVDIETYDKVNRLISCVGFSAVILDTRNNTYDIHTLVVPFDSEYNVAVIATLLEMPVAKVFQNGKYDNAYLLRFGCVATAWLGDTIDAFHSWYCELPKSLDFITAFMIRKWQFWKNESQTTDKMEYFTYNAKDCFTTAICWLALMKEMPDWAWRNYREEFPLVFPCLLTELRGLKRDGDQAQKELSRFEASLELQLASIRKMVNSKTFNPSSPKQTLLLFQMLGSKDIKNSTPSSFDTFSHRHPINARIAAAIIKYRKDRKLITSYLTNETEDGRTKTWNGRIFYSLNPFGTDTGRLASKESAFWCGWQIHNWPRDRSDINIKRTVVADPGFLIGEADYEQAESRDTAYLSGDKALIAAVDDKTRDFHGINASAFFGIPYHEIVRSYEDDEGWHHKTLNKTLRDTSKRTNHGANYNMQELVLLQTMGIDAVLRAKKELKLPANWSLLRVCRHLLDTFDATYPVVRGDYYKDIVKRVLMTKMLVGPTGWTRYCFGRPKQNKQDLNALVAHPSQSLNAMTLNKAYLNVYNNIALPYPRIFKLGPQIHDSIFFQYRKGEDWLIKEVKKNMEIPTPVTDIYGITRTLLVPVAIKYGAECWGDLS